MREFIHVISGNSYFREAVKFIIKESPSLYISCCGNIVIIDTEYISEKEKIDINERVCHIIFVTSREAHKAFLSSFEWNLSVTYVNKKCTPDYFRTVLIGSINSLSRRVRCRVYYNFSSHNNLSEKELKVTKDLMLGKSLTNIAKDYNISYKTALNYRNGFLYRSFEKLDITAIRLFRLTIKLSEKYSQNGSLSFNDSTSHNCPVRNPPEI
ncbi:hypothetical protein V8O11_14725 [Erwinia aphidicola]|uniref:hypothetical protein n=1 Tax=Erwinia aphidicola TaxID=68334 RepID=UPI00300CD5BD